MERPISGALVVFYNLADTTLTRSRTAPDGTFVVASAPVGVYDLIGRYYFVGARYRGTIIPKFIVNLFANEGGTFYSNTVGVEADLRRLVERGLDLPDAELAHLCERGVRNHDPCISCAAHFLRLDVDRA